MTQMIPMILRESASAEVSWGEEGGREGGRERKKGGREGEREEGREGGGGREKGNSSVDSVGTDIPVLHLPGFLWCSAAGQSE